MMDLGNRDQTLPTVDYARHPAFASFGENCLVDEGHVRSLIEKIDAAWSDLQRTAGPQGESIRAGYRKLIIPISVELETYLLAHGNFREDFRRFIQKVFHSANEYLLNRLLDLPPRNEGNIETLQNADEAQRGQRMLGDGYFHFAADRRLAAQIWRQTAWERSIAERKADRRPHGRSTASLHPNSPAMATITRALQEKEVYGVARHYMKTDMDLLYAALEFSHDRQTWYKGCYADIGLADARTTYMHFDADHNVLKMLVYLEDVEAEGGPFSYVGGSHLWRRSVFTLALLRGFDSEQQEIVELEEDKSDYKLKYYRPRFLLPEFRSELMKLPAMLRGSTHFGDDVLDESALSSHLLAAEKPFVGEAGTMVLFDGSSGIHRGSLVKRGHRWAVQIGLKVRGSNHQISAPGLASIAGRARYYLHRAKRQVLGE